ncbi:tetratricopeptide repeat protein [Kitasatospora purpeofusca]
MAQTNRGGRPFGPIRAESPEAEELADFLRHLVVAAGRTVADIARTVGRAPGTVSENLSGRVPTEQFVRALVGATSRDPRDLGRALNLLRAARDPAPPRARPGGALPGGGLPGGSVEEQHGYLETLYSQLSQARGQRDELRLALDNTEKVVTVLLFMLATLQHRVGELTEERNRLLGHRAELARLRATQQRLVHAHDRERRAMDELLRAETRRTEVEVLLSQVLDQMGRLTERVALLQDADGGQPGDHRTDRALAPAESAEDPIGEDIDRALERLGAINEEGDRTVRRLADAWDAREAAPLEPAPGRPEQEPDPAHTAPSANGRVVSFYSYKGGSGRTTITANCAWILAANGFRVLAVDSLAVGLRLVGRTDEARQLAEATYRRHLERHGPGTPAALASALNLAAAVGASGDHEAAQDLAGSTYEGHRELFGPRHPFTYACAANLAQYRRRCGDTGGAVLLGHDAVRGLTDTVGPEHPSTSNAMLTLANSCSAAGDHGQAEELGRSALHRLSDLHGQEHPDTLVCRANLSVTLHRQGRHHEAAELRAQALTAITGLLGNAHPHVRDAREWLHIDRDLEPQPF